ncbi:hypothetical protein PGQ11_006020 [Apiospora arundinis]|uniref:Uncharacterized protein n=1 Tax=Apiospora arundinis TaxID=335852 RepID=A0ABR2IRF3_9PEZI
MPTKRRTISDKNASEPDASHQSWMMIDPIRPFAFAFGMQVSCRATANCNVGSVTFSDELNGGSKRG